MTAIGKSLARSFPASALLLALAPLTRAQVFDYEFQGTASQEYLGYALNRIGDLDRDGCEDFIVGAPGAMVVSSLTDGEAIVYSGRTGTSIATILGNSGSFMGYAVDGKIDSDRDGYPDVLVGAPSDSTLAPSGGRVVVFSPHQSKILIDLYGTSTYGDFGTSVRSLQNDLDGDGVNDFIVGAPGYPGLGYNDAATVVYSGATGSILYSITGQSGSESGHAVSDDGDVNGDGVSDFLIGAPYYVDSGGNQTGRVTAWSGKDGTQLWGTKGVVNSLFGFSLGHPGDLDGDGFGDCIVGAPLHDDLSGNQTGVATVLSGASGSVLYKVYGDQAGDLFGQSVQSVDGDVDHDGTNDLIVGAPGGGGYAGYARLISGATGNVLFTYFERTSDPTLLSDYGIAVAGGDLDGDGRTDVLIGGLGFNSAEGIVETWTTAVASWSNYGSGWPGTLGVPSLTALSDPVVGQSLSLSLSNSAGVTTIGLLMVGFATASIPTTKGGTLLVDPLLFISLLLPSGALPLTGMIPNDPSLYGFNLYLQALELDPGASKGLSFTPGLDLYFGFN